MNIELVHGYDHKDEIKALFTEYTDMLVEGDSRFAGYLQLQNYDDELENLHVKYGLPNGRLYLLYCDGLPAGCIALHMLDEARCELKRLYVRPEFRGHRLGDILVKRIIDDANEIGYTYLLLDTLPFLKSAIKLYKRFGFREVTDADYSPLDTTIYMRLDLR